MKIALRGALARLRSPASRLNFPEMFTDHRGSRRSRGAVIALAALFLCLRTEAAIQHVAGGFLCTGTNSSILISDTNGSILAVTYSFQMEVTRAFMPEGSKRKHSLPHSPA